MICSPGNRFEPAEVEFFGPTAQDHEVLVEVRVTSGKPLLTMTLYATSGEPLVGRKFDGEFTERKGHATRHHMAKLTTDEHGQTTIELQDRWRQGSVRTLDLHVRPVGKASGLGREMGTTLDISNTLPPGVTDLGAIRAGTVFRPCRRACGR